VDIGANKGQFTLATRQWSPNAKVIAFEPLKKAADTFKKVFYNDSNVSLYRAAIGPEAGETIIHVSGRDDSSSLLQIGEMQERLYPGTAEVHTERVTLGPLSDFISAEEIFALAMLKLDVQGFELEALSGCKDLLKCFFLVYVECSFVELYQNQAIADEIIAWLRDQGFKLIGVYNLCYDHTGLAVQGDFLFKKID